MPTWNGVRPSAQSTDSDDNPWMITAKMLTLRQLNPDLKRRFLSVTFEQCNTEDAAQWTDEFLGNFSDDLIADMLRQENQEGREISAALLGYIQKFSDFESVFPIEGESPVTDPADKRQVATEEYTDSDTDSLLKEFYRIDPALILVILICGICENLCPIGNFSNGHFIQ